MASLNCAQTLFFFLQQLPVPQPFWGNTHFLLHETPGPTKPKRLLDQLYGKNLEILKQNSSSPATQHLFYS